MVVEACLAEGERSGGCRSITLTAALLDQVQDEAAWRDLLVPDFTEPDFICQVMEDDQYQSGGWTWDHERHDLTLVRGPEGGIESILLPF